MKSLSRICTISSIAAIAGFMLAPGMATGQTRDGSTTTRTSTSPLLVVRSSGSYEGMRSPAPPPVVLNLTSQQIMAILSATGLTLAPGSFVKVTGDNLRGGNNRVSLSLTEAHYVNAQAVWMRGDGMLELGLQAIAANEQYLIDCAVQKGNYSLVGPHGTTKFEGVQNVTALYKAPDAQWLNFVLRNDGTTGWGFTACQVTRLQ